MIQTLPSGSKNNGCITSALTVYNVLYIISYYVLSVSRLGRMQLHMLFNHMRAVMLCTDEAFISRLTDSVCTQMYLQFVPLALK